MKILRIVLIILAVLASVFVFIRFYYTKSFSPSATAEFDGNGLQVTVDYCQPSKKGRLIFGEEKDKALVPYGKWWRTGANEATVIKFSKDVKIAGKSLKAGTYTLFTIPEKNNWTVIINQEVGQWGLSYDDKKNVLSVPVPSSQADSSAEQFKIDFAEQPNGADMILQWDSTQVVIPIR
ncbi:MAG: DUF2911 domain-containing protein [Bacteroidota bacterium]|jgi:hypothetical protein